MSFFSKNISESLQNKIENNIRIDENEALELFETDNLLLLGKLANARNKAVNNNLAFYNINRHINPTNVCVLSCKFCSFSRKPGEEGAYAYTIEEMVEKAKSAVEQGATEVHMVGGLHPRWSFDYYLETIRTLKSHFPDLHIKAFTAVELDWFAKKTRTSVRDVLEKLIQAGLGSIPGGGAEIFHPEIREKICDTKVTAEQWIETHRTAHELGLHSNATMLYGHIENYKHRIDHMRRLRELQDITKGFNAFIPLSFQPHGNDMGINRFTAGIDDLKTIAVARLYLDNFKHLKSYWVMMGHDIAQLGLEFGANDLDGTVVEEKISRMAGGRSGVVMSKSYIHQIIRQTNKKAVERNTIYQIIKQENHKISNNTPEFLEKLDLNELAIAGFDFYQDDFESKNSDINFFVSETNISDGTIIKLNSDSQLGVDWVDLKSQIDLINSNDLIVESSQNISIVSFLKALCFIKQNISECQLYIKYSSLYCLTPKVSGNALNQDPRYKIIPLLKYFYVKSVLLDKNEFETEFNNLHNEIKISN